MQPFHLQIKSWSPTRVVAMTARPVKKVVKCTTSQKLGQVSVIRTVTTRVVDVEISVATVLSIVLAWMAV